VGSTGGEALFQEFLQRMDRYGETRDFPAIKGPSYLGVHLRFGTVSIRALAAAPMRSRRQATPARPCG
jgi:deoxyribodipyrimidine photo-lyase